MHIIFFSDLPLRLQTAPIHIHSEKNHSYTKRSIRIYIFISYTHSCATGPKSAWTSCSLGG